MEKKTLEEIRTAVLAYCEEVCPNEHSTAHFEVGMLKRQSMGSVFYWLHVDGLSTIAIHENATDDHIFAAYRLLGLEARDAVSTLEKRLDTALSDLRKECDISGKLTDENTKLESRNAAPVAALEELRKLGDDVVKHVNRNDLSRAKMHASRWDEIWNKWRVYIRDSNHSISPAPVTLSVLPDKCTCTYAFQGDLVKQCRPCKESRFIPAPVTEGKETTYTIEQAKEVFASRRGKTWSDLLHQFDIGSGISKQMDMEQAMEYVAEIYKNEDQE